MIASDPLRAKTAFSSQEADRRVARFGPNEPAAAHHYLALREFLTAVASPLVLILLCAAVISMFVGEAVDASLIIAIVLIGVTINFVQSHRSQRAAEMLREQVSPTATAFAMVRGGSCGGKSCPETRFSSRRAI